MVNNIANAFGGNTISKSFAELTKKQSKETRTSDEIISDICGKLGKIGKE